MFQFATAWVAKAEAIGSEDAQVLVYLSQEPGQWRAHHRCICDGMYLEWSLKWEDDDRYIKATEYINAVKQPESETRSDIEAAFRTQLIQAWPIP